MYRKLLNKIVSILLTGIFFIGGGATFAQNIEILPPIHYLLLQDAESVQEPQTHLQRVLAAYANPDSQHIFIAAHRGGRENDRTDQAPGNSIANIDNAVENKFDLYESDIEILGDDTLIVFHDNWFNNLTNCDALPTCGPNELLDNNNLTFAKSLRLTYVDGSVSDQTIPTLEEFLTAAKDKIMVKFDLKGGTFGSNLNRIFNIVEATDTAEQVLIRGGASLLDIAEARGLARLVMRRYDDNPPNSILPTATDITTLAANYDVRAISIPTGAGADVIAAANAAGLVVEIHESQSGATLEDSWESGINAGYRQFHSFKPSQLFDYLEANGHREF